MTNNDETVGAAAAAASPEIIPTLDWKALPDFDFWGWPVHPAADAFPYIPDEDLEDLALDIHRTGLRDKIVLTSPRDSSRMQLVDGRNRARALRLLGVEKPVLGKHFVGRVFKSDADICAFVKSLNLARRHLTTGQRALAGARLLLAGAVEAADGPLRAAAADEVGVSARSIQYALTVIKRGCKELIALVERDELGVSSAATVARYLEREEQAKRLERWGDGTALAKYLQEVARATSQPPPVASPEPAASPEPTPDPAPPAPFEVGAEVEFVRTYSLGLPPEGSKGTVARVLESGQVRVVLDTPHTDGGIQLSVLVVEARYLRAATVAGHTWKRGDKAILTEAAQGRARLEGSTYHEQGELAPGTEVTVQMDVQGDRWHVYADMDGRRWTAQVPAGSLRPVDAQDGTRAIEDDNDCDDSAAAYTIPPDPYQDNDDNCPDDNDCDDEANAEWTPGTRLQLYGAGEALVISRGSSLYLLVNDALHAPEDFEVADELDAYPYPAHVGDVGVLVRDVGTARGGEQATATAIGPEHGALMLELEHGAIVTLDADNLDAFAVTEPISAADAVDRMLEAVDVMLVHYMALVGPSKEWPAEDKQTVAFGRSQVSLLRQDLRRYRQAVQAKRPNPAQLDIEKTAAAAGGEA